MKKILCALIVCLWACRVDAASCSSTSVGAFTCIQSKFQTNASSSSPQVSTASNVAATSVIVGMVEWVSGSVTLSSLTLSGAGCSGASSSIYNNNTVNIAWTAATFALWGLSAGACTIQFNLSGAAVSYALFNEVAGATNNADPIGTRHALNAQTGVAQATDAYTAGAVTASGTDYIFGASIECFQGALISAGTGYTSREANFNGCGYASEDKSASGSNTVTFTPDRGNTDPLTAMLSVAASGGGGVARPCIIGGGLICDEQSSGDEVAAPVSTFPGRPHD